MKKNFKDVCFGIICLTVPVSLLACVPREPSYEVCYTDGCGDNVNIDIVGNFNSTDN